MLKTHLKARAFVTVHQERPYLENGVLVYRQVGQDERVGNLITDAGRVTLHTYIYGTTAQRTAASLGTGLNFIGLSDDATTPSAGDTSLTGEFVADGLERVQGTVVLPSGAGLLTTIENIFTYSGIPDQTLQKTALFDAISGGNMAHELLFTQRTLATGDTITLTFEITLT